MLHLTEFPCSREQDNNEGFHGLLLWGGDWAHRGLEKEMTLTSVTFQKYVIGSVMIDAKRQQTGSVKVKIDLCQGKILA